MFSKSLKNAEPIGNFSQRRCHSMLLLLLMRRIIYRVVPIKLTKSRLEKDSGQAFRFTHKNMTSVSHKIYAGSIDQTKAYIPGAHIKVNNRTRSSFRYWRKLVPCCKETSLLTYISGERSPKRRQSLSRKMGISLKIDC